MKSKTIITMLIALFVLIGTASASAILTLPTEPKEVLVGGPGVDFDGVLITVPGATGTLAWQTFDTGITAEINDAGFSTVGEINGITTTSGTPLPFTLTVKAGSTVTFGTYDVYVKYCKDTTCVDKIVKASATGTVAPIPEVSTAVSTAIGLLGILGLIKFSKKN